MSKHSVPSATRSRRRFTPIAIATGIAAAALISFSMSGALAGFTATISNPSNSAAAGTVLMTETSGGVSCYSNTTANGAITAGNSASCTTINKFGGSTTMVPGQTVTSAVAIKNSGSVTPAAFTLSPGSTCTQYANGAQNGTATDVCAEMNVVVTSDVAVAGSSPATYTVYSGTVANLAGKPATVFAMPPAPAPGATVTFTFAVTLASGAGNTYQGLGASLPLVWQFNS